MFGDRENVFRSSLLMIHSPQIMSHCCSLHDATTMIPYNLNKVLFLNLTKLCFVPNQTLTITLSRHKTDLFFKNDLSQFCKSQTNDVESTDKEHILLLDMRLKPNSVVLPSLLLEVEGVVWTSHTFCPPGEAHHWQVKCSCRRHVSQRCLQPSPGRQWS